MKRLLSLCIVLFVTLATLVNAQSADGGSGGQSAGRSLGYYIGFFFGLTWPFIVFGIAVFVVIKLFKKKKTAA